MKYDISGDELFAQIRLGRAKEKRKKKNKEIVEIHGEFACANSKGKAHFSL